MKQQLRDAWVQNLRSRQFQQGKAFLERDGKNCCLGVLCRTIGLEPVAYDDLDRKWWYFLNPFTTSTSMNPKMGSVLQLSFLQAVGLTENQQEILTEMNDGGKTFEEIADYIEANVEVD